jgi:hypothetical protein
VEGAAWGEATVMVVALNWVGGVVALGKCVLQQHPTELE